MRIGNHNTDDSVFVIAEIGNNHEGDFELAKEMVFLAAESGADAVKFQTNCPGKTCFHSRRKNGLLSSANSNLPMRNFVNCEIVLLKAEFNSFRHRLISSPLIG